MNKYNYSHNNHCKCGKLICNDAKRCGSCARKGINSPTYIDGRCSKKYYCIDCGKQICYPTWRYGSKRCKSCETKYQYKVGILNHKGKNHPNWQNGISKLPYLYNWNIIRKVILKRFNYICQLCYKNTISVHHIDYNKQNCREDNLITLCRVCNSKVNFNRDYWFAYFTYIMEE